MTTATPQERIRILSEKARMLVSSLDIDQAISGGLVDVNESEHPLTAAFAARFKSSAGDATPDEIAAALANAQLFVVRHGDAAFHR